eukprot:gene17016-biopygen21849
MCCGCVPNPGVLQRGAGTKVWGAGATPGGAVRVAVAEEACVAGQQQGDAVEATTGNGHTYAVVAVAIDRVEHREQHRIFANHALRAEKAVPRRSLE